MKTLPTGIGTIAVCKKEGSKYHHLYKEIMEYTSHFQDMAFRYRAYLWQNDLKEIPTCQCGCGTELKTPWKFQNIQGHSNKSEETKQRKIQAYREKYGVDNPSQMQEIKDKKIATNMEKFGVPHAAQNEEIKEKTKQYFIDTFGVDNPAKNEEIRKKIKERVSPALRLVKDRMEQTRRKNFYRDLTSRDYMQNMEVMFTEDEYVNVDTKYKFKCKICGNIVESRLDAGRKTIRCFTCIPKIETGGQSILEHEIVTEVKKFDPNVIENDRKIISPLELDIVSESNKIAIEVDGLYWHSEVSGDKNRFYHRYKTDAANKAGYRLIHIFEDEWYNSKRIVINRLKHIFQKTKWRIYARKCEVRPITELQKGKFLRKYHIQGNDQSTVHLGLFYKNRLVSVMTFGNYRVALGREKKENCYELIRYCSNFHFSVIGGASKILSYFEAKFKPKELLSYADCRWSNGKLYDSLGFTCTGQTAPNYWYFNEELRRFHRYKFRKSELSKLLENFSNDLSEWENMQINGYDRIWDLGSYRYIKTYASS